MKSIMLVASIDIGSNTTLLLIAKKSEQGELIVLEDRSTVTGLGRGVQSTGMLSSEAIDETLEALKSYCEIIKSYDIKLDQVVVTATEATRIASNGTEFIEQVYGGYGLAVRVINAETEAYYTALGVVLFDQRTTEDRMIIMDIGGASTELILATRSPFKILATVSLPVGSVLGTEWERASEFEAKMKILFDRFNLSSFSTKSLVCVAGSMTSVAGMIGGLKTFDSNLVNGSSVSFADYVKFVGQMQEHTENELLGQYPFLGKRAKTIVAGANIAKLIAEQLGVESLRVSTYGLRHGTAGEKLNG
jgi:exopolyphosphatase / guanosine-5'-triphosphate,3'-diphosphate pyrophosphatase